MILHDDVNGNIVMSHSDDETASLSKLTYSEGSLKNDSSLNLLSMIPYLERISFESYQESDDDYLFETDEENRQEYIGTVKRESIDVLDSSAGPELILQGSCLKDSNYTSPLKPNQDDENEKRDPWLSWYFCFPTTSSLNNVVHDSSFNTFLEDSIDQSFDVQLNSLSCNQSKTENSFTSEGGNSVTDTSFPTNPYMCYSWHGCHQSTEVMCTDINTNTNLVTKKNIRNRIESLSSRRKNIRKLRVNLTPFSTSDHEFIEERLNQSKYSPVELDKKIHSFDDINPSKMKTCAKKNTSLGLNINNNKWGNWSQCGTPFSFAETNSDTSIKALENEESLCYDSDPSEFIPKYYRGSKSRLITSELNKQPLIKYCVRSNEDKMLEVLNCQKCLIWHKYSQSTRPVAVQAWIERGSTLSSSLIQPKFVWQQRVGDKDNARERSVLRPLKIHSIDLLDITRVLSINGKVDREKYPFARPSCSFQIRFFNHVELFEARNEIERDTIITGLKLLVARLGSMIMVEDNAVLEEYFTPAAESKPGEAPNIFTTDFFDDTDNSIY